MLLSGPFLSPSALEQIFVSNPEGLHPINRIIPHIPIPVEIPTRKPYRIFADKPLKGGVVVSGSVVVEVVVTDPNSTLNCFPNFLVIYNRDDNIQKESY